MKRFLPVIHVADLDQAQSQADLAVNNGADGVWLINHDCNSEVTLKAFDRVRFHHPTLWMGVNLLGIPSHTAMTIVSAKWSQGKDIKGLWGDDGGIRDTGPSQGAKRAWFFKRETGWDGEYFGGVAFKSGPIVSSPASAAKEAASLMDVVTTSGRATGVSASIEKIRAMRGALAGPLAHKRLAIASGITPENVGEYLPYIDDFLVATGVSKDFHTFDADKMREVADLIAEAP